MDREPKIIAGGAPEAVSQAPEVDPAVLAPEHYSFDRGRVQVHV